MIDKIDNMVNGLLFFAAAFFVVFFLAVAMEPSGVHNKHVSPPKQRERENELTN